MGKHLLTVLALAATLSLSTGAAHATHGVVERVKDASSTSALTGVLAFVVSSGGDDFINTMNANGSGVRQIASCGPGSAIPRGRQTVEKSCFRGRLTVSVST